MRYAILSDVHGNLEALNAVLKSLADERIDGWLSTGDIVGYGADPAACIQVMRSLSPRIVAGNHDWAVAGRLSLDFFNAYARDAILWSREVLSEADIAWLGSLDLVSVEGDVTLVHSTLTAPQDFDYLLTAYDAFLSLERLTTRVCFVGHSHVPVTFSDAGGVSFSFADHVDLSTAKRFIVNTGSIGQPRDENPRASFGVFDSEAMTVELRRVEYDVAGASRKILRAGLPSVLAERLWIGK